MRHLGKPAQARVPAPLELHKTTLQSVGSYLNWVPRHLLVPGGHSRGVVALGMREDADGETAPAVVHALDSYYRAVLFDIQFIGRMLIPRHVNFHSDVILIRRAFEEQPAA